MSHVESHEPSIDYDDPGDYPVDLDASLARVDRNFGPHAGPRWEYLTERSIDAALDDMLDMYGARGWELVQVVARGPTKRTPVPHYRLIFKRPRPADR